MEAFTYLDAFAVLLRALTYVGVVLAAGSALLRVSFGPQAAIDATLSKQAVFGSLILISVSTLTAIKFLLAWEAGPSMLFEIPSGRAVLLRLAFTVAALGFFWFRMRRLTAVAALGLAVSFGFEGHSHSLEDPNFPWFIIAALVVIHVAIVSWWLAVIWPLRRAAIERESGLWRAAETFGRQATAVVPVLLLAGGGLITIFYLSETGASTGYQVLMIVKLAFVGALLWLAAMHKLQLVPALKNGETATQERLARSLTIEGTIGLSILLVTATMVSLGLE